jgi:hypothetical protein
MEKYKGKAYKGDDSEEDEPKRPNKVLRKIRNVLLGIVAMVVVFVLAGLAYVYFTEPADITPAEVPEEQQQDELQSFGEPSTPRPDAPVGVSVQAFTSPVAPGSNVSLAVRTLRDSSCEIAVYSDEESQTKVNDSGLITKIADEYGNVSWTWTVNASASEGEWPIEVECTRNEQSGVLLPVLEVKLPE